ncbi:hypothetical protein EDB86DRAFT_2834960 [Lactarius hatsudake]|nr:hypothetical protein EDB86DRAFT_2834960 [Lactarius hatsudake]
MNDLDETKTLPSRAPTGVPREPLPRRRNELGFGQCIKSLTAASALSLWPSPPPLTARRSTLTPTLSQHARAAMSRHARPTTTLAHRVHTRLLCAPHPPPPARGPMHDAAVDDNGDDNDDEATLHNDDDGEATSP